jgi:hypothetical protein
MNKVSTFKEFIESISIDSAGEFYFGSPGLVIPPPDRGHGNLVQATGTVSLDSFGSISSVTITESGDGYTTPPTPYIVGFPSQYGITSGLALYGFGYHDSIPVESDSTDGEGMTVNVTIDSFGSVSLVTASRGNQLYTVGDTITIQPNLIGGNIDEDPITAQITKINGGTTAILSSTISKLNAGDVYVQPKISPFVGNQLPEVLQVDFPLFKTFFEKYYQFLEQTNTSDSTNHGPLKVLQDFLSKLDVDFNDDGSPITDDNFLIEFFKDYAKDFPLKQSAKLSRVIKDINSFYTAKGSPEAIKYLFKALYNEDVGVVNSGQFILRPSSNQFTQDYVIKVFESESNPNNPLELEGRRIDLHYSVSEGASTQNLIKTTTVKRATKISYTNPQTFELVLDLPPSFTLVGPGVGQDGYDDQLFAYVCGNVGTITGTGTGGIFENPSSSVVDGTYTITESDYTSYLDVEYQNNVEYPKGTYVTANGKLYVTVNEGTTDSSGTGPTHESGEVLNGTSKFRFLSFDDHKTTSSTGAEFEVVIQGNSIDSVTVNSVGSNYVLGEIFEIPTTVFGGAGTPPVKFKVGTITSGKIDHVLITDGGTGFSANPGVTIKPNPADTILSDAAISTRITDGVVTSTSFISNARGIGYNNPPELKINVANLFSYITLEGEEELKAFPTRVLNGSTFNTISPSSSTTNGGFNIGDTFKVSETGSTLGQYAIDYFLEDYTISGATNNGYIKVTALSDNGYPSEFEVIAVGAGYYRADFKFDIVSDSDQTCTIDVTTGYNALLAGVFKDAGSFLSDANKVFDNRIYQHFSYEIESERPQAEWDGYVKRAAHPIGFGVFGNLQIKQDVDLSSNFVVETDVYMFFKYPEIEEILISDDDFAKDMHKPSISDSIFPGDGLSTRQNIGVVVNKFDVTQGKTDSFELSDEFGPYTLQGTEVQNVYATEDGTILGAPYFFVHGDREDDYIERFANGDYFLEDYVEQGNPFKDIEMVLDSTTTGGYATDYFLEDYALVLDADPERGTTLVFIDDAVSSLSVHIEVAGGVSPVDGLYATSDGTLTGDPYFLQNPDSADDYVRRVIPSGDEITLDDSSITVAFIFFRTSPTDFDEESVTIDDTAVPELNRVLAEDILFADAFDRFEITTEQSDTINIDDSTVFDVTRPVTDTYDVDDSTEFDVTTTAVDTMNMQDIPSVEAQPVTTDTFALADSLDKFDIGVGPSDTIAFGDGTSFEVATSPTETPNVNESTEFDITTGTTDTFGAADSGSLISQSYMEDLTYFAEDYVADSVINF